MVSERHVKADKVLIDIDAKNAFKQARKFQKKFRPVLS